MSYESPSVQDTRIDVGALLGAVVRRLPRIILVTLALLVAAYVLLMFSPRLYESTASILVEPRGTTRLPDVQLVDFNVKKLIRVGSR